MTSKPTEMTIVVTPEQQEMQELFSKVQNPDDWRAPIDAWVPAFDAPQYIRAIQFFTATEAEIVEARFNPKKGDPGTMFRLKAKGYRMGPAGP